MRVEPALAREAAPRRRPGRRRSPGWVPNQHGAWAMLASPLLVGAIASGPAPIHALLGVWWFVGYFAFFATSLWLKSGRKARFRRPVAVYAASAAVGGGLLAWLRPDLLRWAPLFVLPLGVGLWAAAHRQERALLAGVTTVVGSALMTVVAYDAGAGSDWSRAWWLAASQFLYFAGTVFYVKSMIRERGNERFHAVSVAAHGLATVAVAARSWWLTFVFALLTLRAWIVPRYHLTPKQIGIAEIASTLVVAIVSLATL
ncbi:MAG: YwiC-like family protein [Dermatophilaceae bacterium]